MRASFQKDLVLQDDYSLKGDVSHHLVNVVRIELNEEILLLNGAGLVVKTKVTLVSKKEVQLKTISHHMFAQKNEMDLALGIPKKEALELVLKQAVELGFRKIYLIRSQYSQTRIPESDRMMSLMVSAVEQSNSAFMPEIVTASWEDLPASDYAQILMMDSQNKTQASKTTIKGPRLLVVGPEGGFSAEEINFLHKMPNIWILNLPTPILRTPTAVAAGAGIVLGSLLD